MKTKRRIHTCLEPSEHFYRGGWYYQGNRDTTCTPWSLANASLILGERLDPKALTSLLRCSQHKDGLNLDEARKVLQKYPDLSIGTIELPSRRTLKRTPEIHTLSSYLGWLSRVYQENHHVEKDLENKVRKDIEAEKCEGEKRIKSNAPLIKRVIDDKKVLVACVTMYQYYDKERTSVASLLTTHTICLSGYKVLESGFMNVQVIDPLYGIYWISFEHLSSCIADKQEKLLVKSRNV